MDDHEGNTRSFERFVVAGNRTKSVCLLTAENGRRQSAFKGLAAGLIGSRSKRTVAIVCAHGASPTPRCTLVFDGLPASTPTECHQTHRRRTQKDFLIQLTINPVPRPRQHLWVKFC